MATEVRNQVKVVVWQVQKICECGHSMEYTGETLRSHPPLYPHICKNCKRKENFDKVFPYHVMDDK